MLCSSAVDTQFCGEPAYGNLNYRSSTLDDIKLDTQSWQGCENVTEHDDTIWLKSFPGL